MPRATVLIGLLVATGCASAGANTHERARPAPIVRSDDLTGCLWDSLGEIVEDERSSMPFVNDESLRRAIGLTAARRGANAVIDYKQIDLLRVAVVGQPSTGRSGGRLRRASATAIRINGGACAAAEAIG